MINKMSNCCFGVVDLFKKEVETLEDALKVFVSRALVMGIACVAFSITAKTFSYICQRAGFSSLANRVALPALTSNIWAVVAVIIGLPALITLYQLIKNYYLQKKVIPDDEIATSVNQAFEKIEELLKCNATGSIKEKDLFNEADAMVRMKKRNSLFTILHEKYPQYIISHTIKDASYNWEWTSDTNYHSLSSKQKNGFSLLMVDIKRKIESHPDQKEIKYSCVRPTEIVLTCLVEYFKKTHALKFTKEGVTEEGITITKLV